MLEVVRRRDDLSAEQAANSMELVLSGSVPADLIEAYFAALTDKGECVDEIVGSALALRERGISFPASGDCIDNCGTGGDGAGTFNISTVAALVVAAAGFPVVKHGNRSASGRVGSADLLEAMRIRLDHEPETARECLERLRFTFLFAPQYHPALGALAALRRRIARPTIFNLIGPLCNPARPPFQLLGTASEERAEKLAAALLQLGVRRAFVVCGPGGVDELIPCGSNAVFEVADGCILRRSVTANDAGLPECTLDDLRGGDLAENLSIATDILQGARGPKRDAVLFNAAAALECAGVESNLKVACARCAAAIDRRDAWKLVESFQNVHGNYGASHASRSAPPGVESGNPTRVNGVFEFTLSPSPASQDIFEKSDEKANTETRIFRPFQTGGNEMVSFLEQAISESKFRVNQWRRDDYSKRLNVSRIRPRVSIPFGNRLRSAAPIAVIAEIKRASPSRGVLNESVEPGTRAKSYVAGGAAAVSVLTEPNWFLGSIDDLVCVRSAVDAPVLRKDFIVDEYDIAVSRHAGADAILLIAACFSEARLAGMLRETRAMKMEALVEVHDLAELEVALLAGAEIIGVNSRNLRTLEVNPHKAFEVMRRVPGDRIRVFESGIQHRDDVRRAMDAGAEAVLVGEALMRAKDVRTVLDDLLEGARRGPAQLGGFLE